jgi:AcrR family transcriptional regulator
MRRPATRRRKFQRARRPEEKELRRQQILTAARRLVGERGVGELSLNGLARRSGVSKPNVYRYFESREDVLLQIWVEEVRELGTRLEQAFASLAPGDVGGVIAAVVSAFATQPMLCELTSIVSPVLERNLSVDAIVRAKTNLATLTVHIAGLLHARLPWLSLEDCSWLASTAATWIAGIWPAVNPPRPVNEALSRAELPAMQPVFERDFSRLLSVLLEGLTRAGTIPAPDRAPRPSDTPENPGPPEY